MWRSNFALPCTVFFVSLALPACESSTETSAAGSSGHLGGQTGCDPDQPGFCGSGGTGGAGGGSAVCSTDHQYAGPLCGPPDAPCRVLRDEPLPDPPVFRNDSPALAMDVQNRPHVLLSSASNGFSGRYAVRENDVWSIEATPIALASAGLVLSADSSPLALVNDGARQTSLWTRTGGTWQISEIVAAEGGWAHAFARSADGTLHAALFGGAQEVDPIYGKRGQTWSYQGIGSSGRDGAGTSWSIALVLSRAGQPHMAFWETGEAGWRLFWQAPSMASEMVMDIHNNLEWFPIALGVTDVSAGGPGTPHILTNRYRYSNEPAPGYGSELVYATRTPGGIWTLLTVAQGDLNEFVFERCGPPPGEGGITCSYQYTTYRPLAVATSLSGDVRLIYARYHSWADLHVECTNGACSWQGPSGVDGQLEIAWPSGSATDHAVLLTGIAPKGGSVAVDCDGRIHAVLYDGAEAWHDSTVRYLLLGVQ